MTKEKYHHDNLKAELIEKGLKLLDEEGYEGFSLRKVAKSCDVSQTAPYRHFKNKDELIYAIGVEAISKFSQSLQQAVDMYPEDPKSQLMEMGCAYVKFFVENPEYLRLMFLSDIKKKVNFEFENADENYSPGGRGCNADPFQILYKSVELYKKETQMEQNDSIEQSAVLLRCWGLVHGMSILLSRGDFPYQGDYMELVKKVIWDGCLL